MDRAHKVSRQEALEVTGQILVDQECHSSLCAFRSIDPADGLRPASRSRRCARKGSLPLGGKQKARANVVKLKFGKVADNIRFGHTRSEVLKNIRDRDAHPANDRLSSSDVWLHGDARAPIHTEKDTCSKRVEQT